MFETHLRGVYSGIFRTHPKAQSLIVRLYPRLLVCHRLPLQSHQLVNRLTQ